MNLAPIYELRSRLRASMIAGAGLLAEDFRLKRAVEEIKPLEALNPVFAKIGQLANALVAEGNDNKEGILMDTITLVDALLCTQGLISITDELEQVEVSDCGSVVTNAPYSVVKGLVEALTTSGNGHYQFVVDNHEEQPQLFADYRVKSAMVDALGAAYAELADKVADWLKQEGEELLPLLQKGFEPKGKKEMVRRVQVIEGIAGGKANDFYLQMLPEAEKEVRCALLYALRHNQENIEWLLELVKKEKGNAKKMAYYALAEMEDVRAEKVFRDMYAKKPNDTMVYLRMTTTGWASKLVGESLMNLLVRCKEPGYGNGENLYLPMETELLRMIVEAFMSKNGTEICDAYRMAVTVPEIYYSHDRGKTVNKWKMSILGRQSYYRRDSQGLAGTLAYLLEDSIRWRQDDDLCNLALELYENQEIQDRNKFFLPAVLVTKLLGEEDCSEWLRKQLYTPGLLGEKKRKDMAVFLSQSLRGLLYDRLRGEYYLQTRIKDDANDGYVLYEQPIKQDIGGVFMDVLIEYCSDEVDERMINFINPQDEACRRKLEEYFYKRALTGATEKMKTYWTGLRKCNSEKCEGLFVKYVKRQGEVNGWDICSSVRDLPGTAEALEKEAEAVLQLIQTGEVKVRYHWNENTYRDCLEEAMVKRRRGY